MCVRVRGMGEYQRGGRSVCIRAKGRGAPERMRKECVREGQGWGEHQRGDRSVFVGYRLRV